MPAPIAKFTANQPRTPLEATVMNEIVDRLNAFLIIKVSPDGCGTFKWGESGGVFDLSQLETTLTEKITKTVLASVSKEIIERITKIEERLSKPSISATCLPGGQIQVTLTI